jgi:hypothetical protein
MIGLLCFVLAVLALPFKSKLRLETMLSEQQWRNLLKRDTATAEVVRSPANELTSHPKGWQAPTDCRIILRFAR